jgi:hypothetical protein
MHKVTRGPEPDSLRQNKARWTQELLDQIRVKGSYNVTNNQQQQNTVHN